MSSHAVNTNTIKMKYLQSVKMKNNLIQTIQLFVNLDILQKYLIIGIVYKKATLKKKFFMMMAFSWKLNVCL